MIYLTTEVGDDSEEEEQNDKEQHESDEVMEEEFDQPSSFVKDERSKTWKRTSGIVILKRKNHATNRRSECTIPEDK